MLRWTFTKYLRIGRMKKIVTQQDRDADAALNRPNTPAPTKLPGSVGLRSQRENI